MPSNVGTFYQLKAHLQMAKVNDCTNKVGINSMCYIKEINKEELQLLAEIKINNRFVRVTN